MGGKSKHTSSKSCCTNPRDIVLAATTLALTLTEGRSRCEVETLINLFSFTTNTLQAILAQRLINERYTDNLNVDL